MHPRLVEAVLSAAVVLVVASCGAPAPDAVQDDTAPDTTPLQITAPATIVEQAARGPVEQVKPTRPSTTTTTTTTLPDTPCSQYFHAALEAGWTREQWEWPVAHIMWGESRCDPSANNGTCCIGLMQLHAGVWDCATYDVVGNLECALHVYHMQGFTAWTVYNNMID